MNRYTYFIVFWVSMFFLFGSCADDSHMEEKERDEHMIMLSGVMTRSGTINKTKLYLKAFLTGSPQVYFDETPITVTGGLEENEQKVVVFPGGTPYYPLGDVPIVIFGFTGKLYNGDRMILKAGLGDSYDAVLSNNGVRETPQPGDDVTTDGTQGSSSNQAILLNFRHVMTQLNVSVKIDSTEVPHVDAQPTHVRFKVPGVVAQGYYPIRSAEPDPADEDNADKAVNGTGTYEVKLGTNYLVPTGANLANQQLTELIIDDYTAVPGDFANLKIVPSGGEPDLKLLPGYAYNLTFVLNRLKVDSIHIARVEWLTEPVEAEVSYDPYTLQLSLNGGYQNVNDDLITKVVLHTTDKMYVGGNSGVQGTYDFAVLPAAGTVNQVELFTAKGLLLSSPVTPTDYGSNTLSMTLSEGGMVLANTALPNGENNPYLITTPVQFMNVDKNPNAHYRQMATIDLNTLNLIGADRIFNGFGDFTGSYDGNGNRIDGLDINGPGLFKSNAGKLKNIRIYSGTMDASGQTYAGSLCGTNTGTIVACFNESRLANATGTVGGICGLNDTNGQIIACLNTGTVLQGANVGGIAGENRNTADGAIRACINTGMLNPAATTLGFICGTSTASSNQVIRVCFNLVGSAQRVLGGEEVPNGAQNTGTYDVSVLYPEILRNGLLPGETEDKRIVNRLNAEIATTPWAGIYLYILDRVATGNTWPVPVKQ